MCEFCLNQLCWRKLQTLGRTMCNTYWRTNNCGISMFWNADCHWVLLNTDRSSSSDTTGGGWWMRLQILVIALVGIWAITEFPRKVLYSFVSSQEIHQCEYWYPICYSMHESGACQTTSQLLGVWWGIWPSTAWFSCWILNYNGTIDHCMALQQIDMGREREEFQLVYTVSHIVIHKWSVNCTSDYF